MGRSVASIDFGTNTARLLIAEVEQGGELSQIHIEREITRMGGGFCAERGLAPEAIERGVACLGKFAALIKAHGVSDVRAVATSAVRDAVNGRFFVELAQRETGIALQIIDGIAEGRLTLAGVMSGLDQRHEDILLFDIGGGSTEYTCVRNGKAEFSISLPLGVVRLVEGKGSEAAIAEKIDRELASLAEVMQAEGVRIDGNTVLVGSAGTATTLAAINMGMVEYDYRLVNNAIVTRKELRAIYERLAPLTPEERLAVPGLEKGREDLIIAGILITAKTMDIFGIQEMKVSDYGMLEGLVIEGMPAGQK